MATHSLYTRTMIPGSSPKLTLIKQLDIVSSDPVESLVRECNSAVYNVAHTPSSFDAVLYYIDTQLEYFVHKAFFKYPNLAYEKEDELRTF